MSVRKRTWKSPSGETKEAWVVDYVDQHGDRHLKTFAKKRDADAHHAIVGVAVRAGTHTADSKSVTVAKAAELWLESCEAAGLERTDDRGLPAACRPAHRADPGRAPALAIDRARWCAASRIGCAGTGARRPWCARPAARSARSSPTPRSAASWRRTSSTRCARTAAARRADGNGKLKIGVDIPAPAEMRAIVGKLDTAAGR